MYTPNFVGPVILFLGMTILSEVEQNVIGTIYGVAPDWSDQKRQDLAKGRAAALMALALVDQAIFPVTVRRSWGFPHYFGLLFGES